MKVPITPEIMKKVWKLHENRLDDSNVIAEIIGISEGSVRRVIQIMTAAKNGEDVDSIGGDNHRAQKEFAKEFFGITKKEEAPVEELSVKDSYVALLEYQNELIKKRNEILVKLCAALGVIL